MLCRDSSSQGRGAVVSTHQSNLRLFLSKNIYLSYPPINFPVIYIRENLFFYTPQSNLRLIFSEKFCFFYSSIRFTGIFFQGTHFLLNGQSNCRFLSGNISFGYTCPYAARHGGVLQCSDSGSWMNSMACTGTCNNNATYMQVWSSSVPRDLQALSIGIQKLIFVLWDSHGIVCEWVCL